MKIIPESEWEWFGYAGHFICGAQCAYHLNTKVGPWVVSTIGHYLPRGERSEEPYPLGAGATDFFETMVFLGHRDNDCGCWVMSSDERDMERYATHEEAAAGHLRMCRKWAEIAGTA